MKESAEEVEIRVRVRKVRKKGKKGVWDFCKILLDSSTVPIRVTGTLQPPAATLSYSYYSNFYST